MSKHQLNTVSPYAWLSQIKKKAFNSVKTSAVVEALRRSGVEVDEPYQYISEDIHTTKHQV